MNELFTECLEINSINKEYKRGKVKANRDITTSFYPGQITAVIGHNGAGKTTLLNQIIGVVKPDSGDITYQGYSLLTNSKLARDLVSMMPQFQAPLTGVTLKESIESILYVRCITKKQARNQVKQIISDLYLDQWSQQSGDKLSGGVQRLTSFAMAVVCPVPIILLDEPTNDVDPIRRKCVWQYIRKLANSGHIVVVVTHNLLEVEQYADRFLLFDHGQLIKDAPTGTLDQHLSSNTLTAIVNESDLLTELPIALETKYIKEECRVIFTLSSEQTLDAVNWILKMISQGKIINYRLSAASLDLSYGGMTNEQ